LTEKTFQMSPPGGGRKCDAFRQRRGAKIAAVVVAASGRALIDERARRWWR